MAKHWYVVANLRTAEILIETKEPNRLKLVKSLTNPLGQEKPRALVRKQSGRSVKSLGGAGVVRYSERKLQNPMDEVYTQFAKNIVAFLQKEQLKNNFSSLTVVAESKFLGKIRSSMKSDLKKSVKDWMKKDLQKIPRKELEGFLL